MVSRAVLNGWPLVPPSAALPQSGSAGLWILLTNFWNDLGVWNDTAAWKD